MSSGDLAAGLDIVELSGGEEIAECPLEHAIIQRVAGSEPGVSANLFGRHALVAAHRYRIRKNAARASCTLCVRRHAREANRERKEKKSGHSG